MITRSARTVSADIDLANPWESLSWCNKLHCTYEELRGAILSVGNSWLLVRNYLHRGVS